MPSADKAILFADDSEDDRFLMLEAAKAAGLEGRLVAVADGEDVIAYLEKWPEGQAGAPRLAILDLKMPRKDGFETLQWIRASKRWTALPVLLLTASSAESDAREARRLGANAYLTKPSRIAELVELLAAVKGFWLRFTDFRPEGP